ncbi:MAG: glycosyltransferase family 39 protein [Lachnospiraceae bacterium]|nr:glycosyltransferase family 39 protein [Lachnospiraceae bacterium]
MKNLLWRNRSLDNKNRIMIVMLAGIFVRLLYVMLMPVTQFAQYDIGTVDIENNVLTGHLGYVFWLVKYHALPNFDPRLVYQFNHPPIHHILSAIWVSFIALFTDSTAALKEAAQYVTFVYSALTLFFFSKLLDETNAGEKGKLLAMIIFAFQPTLIMTAGSLNNDGAGLMFQVLSVWLTLRWHRTKSYKDIIGVALAIGLGMLSKLSAGLVAVPIGVLFIFDFVDEWVKSKKFPAKRMVQYICFGAVCFPIGLCWVIRCYVKYGMPFTYIAFLPDTSPQYVGMYSGFQRMFLPNPIEFIKNLSHGSIGMGWNIWVQMFRTSALGECDLAAFPMVGKLICLAAMLINLVVALWTFVAFFREFVLLPCFGKSRKITDSDNVGIGYRERIFWILSWLVMMYSYFSFAYTYPHECSMNFRYVQFAIIPPLVAISARTKEKEENGVFKIARNIITYAYVLCSISIVAIWCVCV